MNMKSKYIYRCLSELYYRFFKIFCPFNAIELMPRSCECLQAVCAKYQQYRQINTLYTPTHPVSLPVSGNLRESKLYKIPHWVSAMAVRTFWFQYITDIHTLFRNLQYIFTPLKGQKISALFSDATLQNVYNN